MNRRILRGTARAIAVLFAAATVLVALPGVARACFCALPPPVEEAIAEAEWVFIGRQVGRREVESDHWGGVRLQIEVLAVYKGDVPDTVELRTGRGGGDCGVDLAGSPEVGFTVTPDADGVAGVSTCGGTARADVLRAFFEPLPGRVGTGPPGFLVGTEIGPARVAILDTAGELLTYAEGAGRLAAAAVCPGARKVVEIVETGATWEGIGGANPILLEVRDLTTLAVASSRDLEITERNKSQLNGMGWVFDLQCHDPGAGFITYLLPIGVWDALAGANLPGPGKLHLWRDGELTVLDVPEARAVAVDPEAGLFYAITGIEGTTLETRDLAGGLVAEVELPNSHVGWRLALSPDRAELAVLARSTPMERENWFYAEVDRLLVIDLATGAYESHPLPAAGFATLLEARDSGYVMAVYRWEPERVEVSELRGDEVGLVARLGAGSLREALAVGPEAIVFTRPDEDPRAYPFVWRLDPATASESPIEGLFDSRLAITLPDGTEITNLPPLPTTTTTPETTTSTAAPSTTTAPAPTTAGPTTTQTLPPPGSEEGQDNRWVWGVVIGIVSLLGAGAVTVVVTRIARSRQHRPPT